MGIKLLHTAVCTCDGCGVCTEIPIDREATTVECIQIGWHVMEVRLSHRTSCGHTPAPKECLTVCSEACAGKALNARLKHA